MESEEETKPCENCKHEIPVSNFTVHVLHCVRNIAACPTCKEPVPRASMQEHMDQLHKLVPCKQCGEGICGTDLEDHIRDSCANTIKACRFCELDLPRRAQPAHESYCGARTEQCPECGEYVMLKYRQLHLDSNHGFIRLDDDPVPRKENKPTKTPSAAAVKLSTRPMQNSAPKTVIRNYGTESNTAPTIDNVPSVSGTRSRNETNGAISKNIDRNSVKNKKRPAPAPPVREVPRPAARELPYCSATSRALHEERRRRELNAHNLAMGLPPVLNAAEKLEKLRKMDALANREIEPADNQDILRGRVWMSPHVSTGQVLGSSRIAQDKDTNIQNKENKRDNNRPIPANQVQGSSRISQEQNANQERIRDANRPRSPKGKSIKKTNHTANGLPENVEYERRRREFKNLKPMTPEEFVNRFNEMQTRISEPPVMNGDERRCDRFSEIKSSLRELRRGLNEVTAPYNANAGNALNNQPVPAPDLLPCEFCTELIAPEELVIHQTGCRPDLAQFRPSPSPSPRPRSPPPYYEEPVIPCEFCMESLPVYLITEHQERCGREANLLYPD